MRRTLVVCLVLVLAGCQVGYHADGTATGTSTVPDDAPTATPTATPTPATGETGAPGGEGAVRGEASLPLDADLVYYRTRALLNVDTGPPATVVVRDLSTGAGARDPRHFFRLLGLAADARPNDTDVGVAAYVAGPDQVTVNERIVDDERTLETTLAHEYTHIVQFRTDVIGRVQLAGGQTLDGRTASRSLIEGAATFAADAYWERHVGNGTRPAAAARSLHESATGGTRYAVAPYRFGYRYVAAHVDHAWALPRVYDDPPVTTEQLLHPNVTDPPERLSTAADETDAWLYVPGERRMGELFVRTALGTELSRKRAARAADGWATDARLDFVGREDRLGYAWLLRFDDAANATGFADAFDDYRAARAGDDDAFRQRRIGDRTVAVFAGAPAFVEGATATIENGTVAVRAPYARSSSGTPKTSAAPTSAMTAPTATSRPV